MGAVAASGPAWAAHSCQNQGDFDLIQNGGGMSVNPQADSSAICGAGNSFLIITKKGSLDWSQDPGWGNWAKSKNDLSADNIPLNCFECSFARDSSTVYQQNGTYPCDPGFGGSYGKITCGAAHLICPPGMKVSGTTCVACPAGYYKPAAGAQSCTPCPTADRGDGTQPSSPSGATDVGQCFLPKGTTGSDANGGTWHCGANMNYQ